MCLLIVDSCTILSRKVFQYDKMNHNDLLETIKDFYVHVFLYCGRNSRVKPMPIASPWSISMFKLLLYVLG